MVANLGEAASWARYMPVYSVPTGGTHLPKVFCGVFSGACMFCVTEYRAIRRTFILLGKATVCWRVRRLCPARSTESRNRGQSSAHWWCRCNTDGALMVAGR